MKVVGAQAFGERRKDCEGVNELERKDDLEIPHRRVRLEDGMTHELRTPLNVIIGLCQLLERDSKSPLSPMQRDAVDRMERNAHALLQSVNHLLGCMRSGTFE